jgi:hypothetical protein
MAAPVSGGYFPGPVVEFPEFVVGATAPVNALATKWLTSWFASALDESCVAAFAAAEGNADNAHRCWDASVLYPYVDAPLFVVENRFDQNQINDVLLCPTKRNTSNTVAFVQDFGEIMGSGLYAAVQGPRGASKGDGLFAPSCFSHTSNICMQGGPVVSTPDAAVRLRDILPGWFSRDDTSGDATSHMFVDDCNSNGDQDPCNPNCYC